MVLRLNVLNLFYYFFGTLSRKKSLRCSYANVIKTPKEHVPLNVPLNLSSRTLPATCPVVADMYSSKHVSFYPYTVYFKNIKMKMFLTNSHPG